MYPMLGVGPVWQNPEPTPIPERFNTMQSKSKITNSLQETTITSHSTTEAELSYADVCAKFNWNPKDPENNTWLQ